MAKTEAGRAGDRLRFARRQEPDLDPAAPLKAAAARLKAGAPLPRSLEERKAKREAAKLARRQRVVVRAPGAVALRSNQVDAHEAGVMVGLQAAGVAPARVADVLARDPETVKAVTRQPDAAAEVQTLRAALKHLKITQAHALEPTLWRRAAHEVGAPDPAAPDKWVGGEAKDVDAIFRALLASEKVQAAAAGEGNASGAPLPGSQAPVVDLKVLIQALAEP